MDPDRLVTYEEERQQAYKRQTNVGKQKLSKMMIVIVALDTRSTSLDSPVV